MSAKLNSVIELLNRWGELHWSFAAAMFLQVSILIVVLLCLDFAVLRRLRASIRYSLWMLVLVKLMLPVSLHTPMSISRWMPDLQPQLEVTAASRTEPAHEAVSLHTPKVVQGGSEPLRPVPVLDSAAENEIDREPFAEPVPEDNNRKIASSTPPPVISERPESIDPGSAAAAAPPLVSLSWKAYVLFVWTTVALILLALFARRAWLVRTIVARSRTAPDELESQLAECLELMKISGRRMRVRISDDLGSPAICGFWRGTILLPETLL